jgi:thiol:disulfide interchange protein DsbD
VLVDFTAKWCLTCQLNTKPTLESESVRKKMTEVNAIALLENSYTKGPEVVAELNRYERAGIPLVLVYSGDPNVQPEVLPNLITPSIVVGALDRAAKQSKPSVALK